MVKTKTFLKELTDRGIDVWEHDNLARNHFWRVGDMQYAVPEWLVKRWDEMATKIDVLCDGCKPINSEPQIRESYAQSAERFDKLAAKCAEIGKPIITAEQTKKRSGTEIDVANNVYTDIDGNPCSIETLCRKEPYWAANCITVLKEKLRQSNERVAELKNRTFAMAYGSTGKGLAVVDQREHDLLEKQVKTLLKTIERQRHEIEALHHGEPAIQPMNPEWLKQKSKIEEQEKVIEEQADLIKTYQTWVYQLQGEAGPSAVAEAPGVTRPVLHVQSQYDLDD